MKEVFPPEEAAGPRKDQREPAAFRTGVKEVWSGFGPAHPTAVHKQPYGIKTSFPWGTGVSPPGVPYT